MLLSPWKVLKHLFVCVWVKANKLEIRIDVRMANYDTIMYLFCVCVLNELLLGSISCKSQCIGPALPAWLLNMNVQYLEQEGIDPDSKTPGGLSKQGGSHTNWKGNNETSSCGSTAWKTAVYAEIQQAYCLCDQNWPPTGTQTGSACREWWCLIKYIS